MHGSIQPARLTRSRRAHLPAAALLLSGVLVAGCTASTGHPAKHGRTGSAPTGAAFSCPSCYAPDQFLVAYGIQSLLDSGIDGRGETVTLLTAPQPPNTQVGTNIPPSTAPATPSSGPPLNIPGIGKDLAAFDRMFRLPAARIQVVNSLAGSASPWQAAGENPGDIEELHAVAPAATIRVVLMPSSALDSAANATADMLAGLRLAVSGTDVASIGWSLGEHFFTRAQVTQMHSMLLGAAAHHVTVVAGSGDNGVFSDSYGGTPVKEVSLPASDPLVLGVGGTTLTANPVTGAYSRETVWNGLEGGFTATSGVSGGGFSHRYARPAYQDGVPGISARRGVPDVAADANGQNDTPSVTAGGSSSFSESGTSAAAALWGGLMALADQDAHHDLGFVNPAIYRIARSPSYHKAFHDVTTGNNLTTGALTNSYHARPGWDPVTGWGTPNAQVLIPLLARS